MFGFKKREQEHAAQQVAEVAAIGAALHRQITGEVTEALTMALARPGLPLADYVRYSANAKAVQLGINAVLLEGLDAFGPDMERSDQPTRCGAMLAHAARNLAMLSGSLTNPNVRGDINFGITGQR